MLTNTDSITIDQAAARFGVTPSDLLSVLLKNKQEFSDKHFTRLHGEVLFTEKGIALAGLLLDHEGGRVFRSRVIEELKGSLDKLL